jgi:KDO2-lipid IV(A) lauroyltransferase
MSKPRSNAADYAVYLLVRVVVCVLQALSQDAARRLAAGLAWLLYHMDRRHRLAADDNLRHAFPGRLTDAQRDGLVRSVYVHFCRMFIEIIHMPRALHPGNWREHLEMPQGRLTLDCLLSGRPLLLVTGHFGNWELGGYILGLLGFRTHAIARKLDNPYLDQFLRRFRERTGQGILEKHGEFDKLTAVLAGNGAVATLGDQDAGRRGLYVDFFGRPASTHKAIALLSLEHRAPLLVIGVRRVAEPMRYQLVTADCIRPEEYDGRRPDAVKAMTQRFTAALERMVREAPEQYFWLHRRWKHQPARKAAKAACGEPSPSKTISSEESLKSAPLPCRC